MEEISFSELVRLHERLEDEHQELHKYAHKYGHDVINIQTVLPDMKHRIVIHDKQIDNLRKFMWITIGAMGVVNILIPIVQKLIK